MSIAIVFDSAGTLLHTYRVAKNVMTGELFPGIETVSLTFSSPDRILLVIHVHSRDVIDAPDDLLLSEYLREHKIGFGISCTRKVIAADDVADALYKSPYGKVADLKDCIRKVWQVCRKEAMVTMNSGVIVNMSLSGIEFMVTTGGAHSTVHGTSSANCTGWGSRHSSPRVTGSQNSRRWPITSAFPATASSESRPRG